MAEQFANHSGTTLSAAISTTTRPVTFSVASASGLPSSGNFRVIIESEILLITSISGTSLTGSNTEGTTAATHASGAAVTHILTAGALAQLETDTNNTLLAGNNTWTGLATFVDFTNLSTLGIQMTGQDISGGTSILSIYSGGSAKDPGGDVAFVFDVVDSQPSGASLLLNPSGGQIYVGSLLVTNPGALPTVGPNQGVSLGIVGSGFGRQSASFAVDVNGALNTRALSTPAAPTVTPTGTAGSTSYSYKVVAKQADGSFTAAGAAGSTTTGNATLSSSNYNAVSWAAVTGANSYDLYRTVGGATQGKIASSLSTTSFNDQGATASGTAPTTGTTGNATIGGSASISGKILTYNNIATVANGVPAGYASISTTGLTNNVSATNLYVVPATAAFGYRVTGFTVCTVRDTVSSTVPKLQIVFTDSTGSITANVTGANTGNTVGTYSTGQIIIDATAGSTIQYQLSGYASNTANAMTYKVKLILEAV